MPTSKPDAAAISLNTRPPAPGTAGPNIHFGSSPRAPNDGGSPFAGSEPAGDL